MTVQKLDSISRFLSITVFILMIASLYAVFVYVPTEKSMGVVQRIFYFHVPAGILGFFGFFVIFISSVMYLQTKDRSWDIVTHAAAEAGLLFSAINLVTGPIWGKPIWGIWWTWDARLTMTLILWLIYVAFLMLRSYTYDEAKKANLSAVVGIIGFAGSIFDYMAIRWFRTQHPQPVMAGGEESGLQSDMRLTLLICMITFLVLFFYIMLRRILVEKSKDEVEYLRELIHV